MTVYIYGLLCPIAKQIRYIGKSINPEKRLKRHIADCYTSKYYTARWLKTLVSWGLRPSVVILHIVGDDENWQEVERRFIAQGRAEGLPLTNTSAGGEGVLVLDPEIEKKRIAKTRATWKQKDIREKHSKIIKEIHSRPEIKEANKKRMKELWKTKEYSKKVSEAVKAAYASPEARKAQSERSKKAHQNPETKVKRSDGIKAAWKREGAREAHVAALKRGHQRPEVKARKSEMTRQRHQNDPAYREALRRATSDPEMIKRRGAAIKAGWARRLARLAAEKAAKDAAD